MNTPGPGAPLCQRFDTPTTAVAGSSANGIRLPSMAPVLAPNSSGPSVPTGAAGVKRPAAEQEQGQGQVPAAKRRELQG
ncbi:hypothetical protein CHLRE_02g143647v5 [Chlamydomonas reinhardtii]|uniref:Uncharacterized protein n=1 Tax=Chlamydomonas reinhardtii TaxID=3055 RepID=A0A2K3E4M2_CHLRE|nr:uncharacterized protein CHLRE_02g143647v5 [Chlamydomonas reinhardtii]PNW87734.1 hypothetical protein CHLRE_02g143647v5 [Chlamydomonas reinhardtii]